VRLSEYSIISVRTRPKQFIGALVIGFGITAAVVVQPSAQTPPPATSTAPAVNNATPVESTPISEEAAIEWAREIDPATNAPVRRATAFITTDAIIYAVLPVERIEQGSVVEATWSYNGTPVPALTATVTVEQTYENGWIEFHLTLPQGQIWPTGEYTIAIAINSQQVAESTIEVTVPPS
jgi:hypothetical protein